MNIYNKYRKDGIGLHSFVDSADKEQYLYTQFEPDFCHMVFPVFDQPDVKAEWVFKCSVPSDWKVVSNDTVNEAETAAVTADKSFEKLITDIGAQFGVDNAMEKM